ncbi:MAG TPA: GWxTD domain-containing protein [Bacteroidales bacterium]|nr:GWxTD domain-containing protein [Bacteroidales bacterium]
MKKLLVAGTFLFLSVAAMPNPGNLRAFFSYTTFRSPEHGPYIETYLSVLGKSVQYVHKDNGKFQGSILVTMLFKQNDSIRDFRKYELFSPEVDDTTVINFSFLDQQRVALPNGKYDLDISISDKNREMKPFLVTDQFELNYPNEQAAISGIQLIESFTRVEKPGMLTKSGYDFIPYLDNFYPAAVNKLTFYTEMYDLARLLGADEKFIVATSIESFETGKVIKDNLRMKREDVKPVNVVFSEFDISNLPSGNYNLVVAARNKENKEIIRNSMFFQRSNPSLKYDLNDLSSIDIQNSFVSAYTNPDSLREFIRMCFPIASSSEKLFINTQLNIASLETMQRYFLSFWQSKAPENPSGAWQKYYIQVLAVNDEFKTSIKKGYETDRGRVYLQYGPPNSRVQEYNEPRAYPYEIWQYYKIGSQTNRKFVFYTRDYSSRDFDILHSDVLGELYNARWEVELHKRDTDRYTSNPQDIERTGEDDYYGGRSRDLWDNPR